MLSRRTCLGLIAALATPARADASKDGRLSARPAVPTAPPPAPGEFTRLDTGVLYAPKSFPQAAPMPLLVMLHGSGGNARRVAGEIAEHADARGFLVLAPQSGASTWDLGHMPECADAARVDRALAQTFAAAAVGPKRIALAGVSDGASFALSLGLANGDLFRDLLIFSAGFFRIGARVGSPRVFISHGRRDRILSFALGERIATELSGAKYDVTFRPFDGGHEIPEDGFKVALDRFLE